MENIFMVGLSFESIKKKIAAQCAWNDATNLATLPPIVNPMSNVDIDGVIWLKIIDFSCRFAGYVSDVEQSDDIVRIVMHADRVPERSRDRIYHFIEEFVVCSVLEELYSPQQQAKGAVSKFRILAQFLFIKHGDFDALQKSKISIFHKIFDSQSLKSG